MGLIYAFATAHWTHRIDTLFSICGTGRIGCVFVWILVVSNYLLSHLADTLASTDVSDAQTQVFLLLFKFLHHFLMFLRLFPCLFLLFLFHFLLLFLRLFQQFLSLPFLVLLLLFFELLPLKVHLFGEVFGSFGCFLRLRVYFPWTFLFWTDKASFFIVNNAKLFRNRLGSLVRNELIKLAFECL